MLSNSQAEISRNLRAHLLVKLCIYLKQFNPIPSSLHLVSLQPPHFPMAPHITEANCVDLKWFR